MDVCSTSMREGSSLLCRRKTDLTPRPACLCGSRAALPRCAPARPGRGLGAVGGMGRWLHADPIVFRASLSPDMCCCILVIPVPLVQVLRTECSALPFQSTQASKVLWGAAKAYRKAFSLLLYGTPSHSCRNAMQATQDPR